jgi:hypothetical protein
VMRRLSIAVLGVLACGGDNGTGPGSTDVTGTWSASLSSMNGSGASCSSTVPTQLTLNQAGTTLSGSYDGGELFCTAPGGTGPVPVGSGSVVNGTLSGRNLSFDLGTPDFHFSGAVTGTSMAGTAQWTMDFGIPIGVATLNGNWVASKQ